MIGRTLKKAESAKKA